MTVYIDMVFLLNFFFDFLLLLTVSITLKRNTSLKKIFLASLVGSVSLLALFWPFNTYTLFLFKMVLSVIMIIIAFGFKDKKYLVNNIAYFYMTSTVLGGFLYFLNLTFAEKHVGMVFVYENLSINGVFLGIFAPIILYIYIKQRKELNFYSKVIPIVLAFKNGKFLKMNGFLDTGNNLRDPVTKKDIVLVSEKCLKGVIKIRNPMYVPYNSLNNHGLLKCIPLLYLEINGHKRKNYLLGMSEGDLLKDGIDCILNVKCLEDAYDK